MPLGNVPQLLEDALDITQECPPVPVQIDAPTAAVEQRSFEGLFEHLDSMRDGSRRYMKFFGRLRKASVPARGFEKWKGPQMFEVSPHGLPSSRVPVRVRIAVSSREHTDASIQSWASANLNAIPGQTRQGPAPSGARSTYS